MSDARRNQALAEVRRLRDELQLWYADRTAKDCHEDKSPRGQYTSQLDAIRDEVGGAAAIIDAHLQTLPTGGAIGGVYESCAAVERQVIWLWRVWGFFRDKFDQRDHPAYRATLRAADEVVWSCFSPFFEDRSTEGRRQPPPLAYIEADYSPSALRRDQRQALQRRDRDFVLVQQAFQQLPVPILKVPITAVNNPWSLGLIAHECGHFVQPLVAETYAETFQRQLADAIARAQPAGAGDADVWANWTPEIFADWFSIVLLGPWALWTMAQFELAGAETMGQRRPAYPAPVTRLALMAAIADHYGLGGGAMLGTIGVDASTVSLDEGTARDLGYVAAIVPEIVRRLPAPLPPLDGLLDLRVSDFSGPDGNGSTAGVVGDWAAYLRGKKAIRPVSNKRSSARLATAGCALAWSSDVIGTDGPPEALRQRALDTIAAAAMPGVRSVKTAPRRLAGEQLAAFLARADEVTVVEEVG
ncbi:MAG TPA: hypothetical protein VNR90_13350 [Vicinamibacterales bacterium]|nr:hypothetical protein [Vicinamibacterales bacterium]